MAAARLLSGLVDICRQFVGDDTAILDQKLNGCSARELHAALKSAGARKPPAIQQDVIKRTPAGPRNIPNSTPATPAPLPPNPQRHRTPTQAVATEDEPASAGTPTHRGSAEANAVFSVPQVQLKLQQLLHPLSPLESKVQSESLRVGEALQAIADNSATEFAVALGARISKLGCRVVLRRITNTKQYWSKNNTFVVCVLPGARGKPTGLIVDPRFKEQFSTAHMTDRYRDIWSVLPDVFIGQVAQLMALVQVLCHELALMFDSLGEVLPPWRAYNAYISRWISKSCTDSVVSFVDSTWVASAWKSSDVNCCDKFRHQVNVDQGASAQQPVRIPAVITITGFKVAPV